LLNKIYLKFILRSKLNIWLGKKVFKNSGGVISNLIGIYARKRDIKRSRANGFNFSENTDSEILRDKGFLVTKDINNKQHIKSLSKKWTEYTDKVIFPDDGRLQLSSADDSEESKQFIPYLEPLITEDIKNTLESYFKSYMRIINFHIYRIMKPPTMDELDSYGSTANWHTDGSTCESMKLFFMLSDITKVNGPMQVISKKDSERVFKNNQFFFPDTNGKTRKFISEKCKPVSLEGMAGTAFYALTNDSLHRATTPNEGEVRDLVTFYITSSSIERDITNQLEEATYREVYGFQRLTMT
tara:strand:+ start:5170 stop:6066 length:897 start_codon:yes stop_codon:yes gene_type:complete